MTRLIIELPLEVLQHIASSCPFRDVLAINRTCRRFRTACDDGFVFQQSFLNHIGNATLERTTDREVLCKLIRNKLSATDTRRTKMIWASLAAAASDLPLILDELEELLLPYECVPWEDSWQTPDPPTQLPPAGRNMVGVLTTSTILCCPTLNNFTMTASLSGLAAHMLGPEVWALWEPTTRVRLASQISFCLAMGGLRNPALNNMPLLAHRVAQLYQPRAWRQGWSWDELKASVEGVQTTGLLTVACLPWLLRFDFSPGKRDDLPHPGMIPLFEFPEMSEIPLPDGISLVGTRQDDNAPDKYVSTIRHRKALTSFATAPSWTRWLGDRIKTLIDDIGRDEWVGYVSTSQSRYSEIPPPARGMYFVAAADPANADRVLLTSTTGVDARGSFQLRGHVMRSTGSLCLEKRWAVLDGVAHVFRGALTPLGIAGCWGYSSDPDDFMGFVWMYKAEWT